MITALFDLYRQELEDVLCYVPETITNYLSCLLMFHKFTQEELGITPDRATGPDICRWISGLKQTGISFSRLQHHQSALQTFFAMLIKHKYRSHNPADALPSLRHRRESTVRPVSREVVFRLLDQVDRSGWFGLRNYMIISMLWALGLRISELTRLTVGSFEPEVEKNIGLLRVNGKNKKQRALFVVDRLYQNLMVYLSHPESPKRKSQPLFPVSDNKAIASSTVQKKIKRYCRDAGITERITPHVLRHSFATEMYHENVPVHAIQVMMGHARPAETSLYIKVKDSFKIKALRQLTLSTRMSWE